ncbi:EbsA family protein [Lactiplantibacillus fabifermentans]|uniref:Membrane protein n=1 Tax=Lactiplantibacillus fabifermentans T30PCM01 TaxID=1400520 RepID=W6T7M9_9LACO|nr:EbsA family protein [Lactiplantibacillus fabifermentans]ETY74326.1 membrane protein [Lactiplantibacillus fabifermentans T30PCM01]
MNNSKHTFKYQPNLVSSLIVWSWTLLILMVGIIIWLEVMKFKWPFLVLGLVFIALVAVQITMRRVSIDRNLLIFSTVLNRSWLVIPRDQLELIAPIRGGVKVQIDGNEYQFLMTKKSRDALVALAQDGE